MNYKKYFVVLCLGFFFLTCHIADNDGVLMINIGDYETQLIAWNSLNILNYQLLIVNTYEKSVVINVKNGIPESYEPPSWLETQLITIPELFSYIKRKEKSFRAWSKNQYDAVYFDVYYHSELYYPIYISTMVIYDKSTNVNGAYSSSNLSITLTPLDATEQETDGEE